MVRLRWSLLSLTLALLGARSATAGPIKFTGYVENDFDPSNENVRVTQVATSPQAVGQADFMNQNGWVSGWAIKDIRTSYDQASDTLFVGFNTFKNAQGATAIVGDSDGNGDPGGASAQMSKAGGVDQANLGGHKSVALAIAADNSSGGPGAPIVVAGVSADKSTAGPGIDGFTVALPKGPTVSLPYNFGKSLTDAQGNPIGQLAFNPSAAQPGFEFSIKNFSKIPGLDPFKGFWIQAYAGSPDDVVVGETGLPFTRVKAFSPQEIPEPATLLGWSVVAAAGALASHRRRKANG